MAEKVETVDVIAQTMGGRCFHEGRAVVTQRLGEDRAYVNFRDGYGAVERYIDPNAQGLSQTELGAYIAKLNDPQD